MTHGDGQGQHAAVTADMQHCIEECQNCHNLCTQTITHCLQRGGEHAAPEHIRLLLDCAEICETSANFMLRGSPLHTQTCMVCSHVCTRCAEDCERLGSDDALMRRCAEVCRQCAESCRVMASMTM